VQHVITQVFGSVLGLEEGHAPKGGDGLMGLNAPKTGILVTEIAGMNLSIAFFIKFL